MQRAFIMPERRVNMKTFDEIIAKSRVDPRNIDRGVFKITKSIDDKRLAFGWASVAVTVNGEAINDYQEDVIEPDELEAAAYKYVEFYRDGGEEHERSGVATIIESIVFTKEKQTALGLPDGSLPEAWWIGFHVHDADVWEKVKDGTYPMFSIEGEAVRKEIEDGDES